MTHTLVIEGRKNIYVTGVTEVLYFDDNEISLLTSSGQLTIQGKNLEAVNFDTESGDADISGTVLKLFYGENMEKLPNNFIMKIFR